MYLLFTKLENYREILYLAGIPCSESTRITRKQLTHLLDIDDTILRNKSTLNDFNNHVFS